MNVYEVMKEKGIALHQPSKPIGLYKPVGDSGGAFIQSSGTPPTVNGKHVFLGKVGRDVALEEGREAARYCMLNILANTEAKIGDLNKIKQVVKILGFVACADGFYDHPKVIDGASALLIDIFGSERGVGTRSAVGVYSLPHNIPVEIEAMFELY